MSKGGEKEKGFKPCVECSSLIPKADVHTTCVKCLGPQHVPGNCTRCCSMGPRMMRNRVHKYSELFGGPSPDPSPSGSSGPSRAAQSDPAPGTTRSLVGSVSTLRGTVASKASWKSFPKHSAPTSSVLVPRQRRAPEAPAPVGAEKAAAFLDSDWESEPEARTNPSVPKTPVPSHRRKPSKPRDTSGPAPSVPRKSHKHGSPQSRGHSVCSEEATALGPLLQEILARLTSLESGPRAPPIPSTSGAASRPPSPVPVLPSSEPAPEPITSAPVTTPVPASEPRASGSSSRPLTSERIAESKYKKVAGLEMRFDIIGKIETWLSQDAGILRYKGMEFIEGPGKTKQEEGWQYGFGAILCQQKERKLVSADTADHLN
nr:PREDICTED: vegetative cell wall protein gp1-like [Latimeria chalumnae]|eukprot:XP_014342121.1 PREDICTED: vegetative cell wall protein gp1-like [Latimeria chalumnae]